MWLAKSRATDEVLRRYDATSTLPSPEEFGLGTRPQRRRQNRFERRVADYTDYADSGKRQAGRCLLKRPDLMVDF